MKTNLKVGDTFDVVEVLTDGDYSEEHFKIGGWTIGCVYSNNIYDCLNNGSFIQGGLLSMYLNTEIKPVGRLVVTKVK